MRRSAFVLGLISIFVTAFCITQSVRAADIQTLNWLTAKEFTIEKTAELDENQTPISFGFDCTPTTYRTGTKNNGPEQSGCVMQTPVGPVHNDYVLNGPNGTLKLNYMNHAGSMAPTIPGSSTVVMVKTAHGIYTGEYLEVSNYNPSLLTYKTYFGYPTIFTYEYVPVGGSLLTTQNATPIRFLHNTLTYSENGKWLAAIDTERGVWRFDTETWHGKLIGWLGNAPILNSQIGGTNLAVSNTGQFIAVNDKAKYEDVNLSGLKVYDTTSCENLSSYYLANSKDDTEQCEYNDVWNGLYSTVSYGDGIKAEIVSAEAPRRIRFDGDAITFDAVYERVSATEFKAASYRVSIPQTEAEIPHIGLLALGDSYISGEGAFQYKEGTDTGNNKCHNSLNAYPYLLGARLSSDGYNSVACSGAVTEDVYNNQRDYKNQLNPKLSQGDYTDAERNTILATFTPGSINQLKFIDEYKPTKILLSIGGNDVNFSDVITHCVTSVVADSCFGSQSERKELLELTYSQHEKLVQTYTAIREADPDVQLYVVGYPQIAKVDGKCSVNVHLDANEVEFGSLFISRLNATIRNVAESVGARYVDVENALDGYRLCEDSQLAMNGLTMGGDSKGVIGMESYHPTAFGHILLSNKISRATSNLTQAMPTATGAGRLYFRSDDPFITGAKDNGGMVRKLSFEQIVADTEFISGQTIAINYDASVNGLGPGDTYNILFHSKEVQVASGVVGVDGFIRANVKVPVLDLGGHSLHIYATNKVGELINIMQYVYILASATDYDGDGIENSLDSCQYIANVGIDTDGDGVDDTCDGDTAVYIESTTQTGEDEVMDSSESEDTTEEFIDEEVTSVATTLSKVASTNNTPVTTAEVLSAESSAIESSSATLEQNNSVSKEAARNTSWTTVITIAGTIFLVLVAWRLLRHGK